MAVEESRHETILADNTRPAGEETSSEQIVDLRPKVVTKRDPVSRAWAMAALGVAITAFVTVGADIAFRVYNSEERRIERLEADLKRSTWERRTENHYLISHICGLQHRQNGDYENPEYDLINNECVTHEEKWLEDMKRQDAVTIGLNNRATH